MTTLVLRETANIATAARKMISEASPDRGTTAGGGRVPDQSEFPSARLSSPPCTLDLSKSRAHDVALDILRAYKLTGNFHINLEIILKDLGAFDEVTYEIESKWGAPSCPDRRHVVFRPNGNVHKARFSEIIRNVEARVGFDAARPWWARLFC
jgi:hypothetical protein